MNNPISESLQPLVIDPRRQFGRVCINRTRVPADCVAECVYAGDSVDDVADDYGVTRVDVLVACWWFIDSGEQRPNRSKKYRRWLAWTDHAARVLGGHISTDSLCDPDDYECATSTTPEGSEGRDGRSVPSGDETGADT